MKLKGYLHGPGEKKKERKDYGYRIKYSLRMKEGETTEDVLETTPPNHVIPPETLKVLVRRWTSDEDK